MKDWKSLSHVRTRKLSRIKKIIGVVSLVKGQRKCLLRAKGLSAQAVRGGNRHSTQGLNELVNEISCTSQTVKLCGEERMLAGT